MVITSPAWGILRHLNADSESGFSALDFVAPGKLYKKEVLEYPGRFLKKKPSFLLLPAPRRLSAGRG